MANLKLDLSNLKIGSNEFQLITETKTSLKYAGYKGTISSDGNKVTFDDGSELILLDSSNVKFVAAQGSGTFSVVTVEGGVAKTAITELDFTSAGAMTVDATEFTGLKKLVGSDAADKLTVASTVDLTVQSGEGNDVVNVKGIEESKTASIDLGDGDDILNIAESVATGTAAVTLGDGKDVVNVESSAVTVNISDYSYEDGDKINLAYTGASSVFDTAALATVASQTGYATISLNGVTATVKASDYVAAADITADKKNVTFFTATDTGVSKTKEVEINAKGITNDVKIDAAASKLANITLGSGESSVTLASDGQADVINATGSKKVTVTNFTANQDILLLDGAKLSNIKLEKNATNENIADLTYGTTKIGLVNGASVTTPIILNDQKLAYDLVGSTTLDAGADMYYGNEDKNTTVKTEGSVHLADTDKYKNIYKVSVNVDATADEDDKLNLSGFTTTGTTGISINASSAAVGVNVWAYNKNTKATDTINLGSGNAYQDTVSFASNDGKDSVTGFTFGNAENSDILYLRDTQDLQKLAVKQGVVKIGSSQLTIGATDTANDIMQVKLADGTSSLIAGNFDTNTANKVSIDLTSTDVIDFYALNGTKNVINLKKSTDEAVSFRYSNLDANHTAGTSVKSVSVGAGFKEDDEITIGAVANVTTGAGNNHVWVYGVADSAKIQLESSEGKDQVDFASGIDKKVTVTNYDVNEDTIYLRGTGDEDLKAITANYKFAAKNNGIQITGVENASSVLVLDNVGELKIKTLNGSELTAIVNENDANTPVAFSKDVSIYAGMKKIEADMSVDGEIAVRVGTKGEIGIDSSDTYYISDSVTEFDASSSDAVFRLAGSSTAGTTLKGGNTENSFYGGGSFSDTMVGNSSAVDTFYFGKGDGKDTILEADGKDTVVLLNVELDDVTVDTAKNALVINSADTLTFGENASEAFIGGELTIKIAGSEYVCQEGKLVAKNA